MPGQSHIDRTQIQMTISSAPSGLVAFIVTPPRLKPGLSSQGPSGRNRLQIPLSSESGREELTEPDRSVQSPWHGSWIAVTPAGRRHRQTPSRCETIATEVCDDATSATPEKLYG